MTLLLNTSNNLVFSLAASGPHFDCRGSIGFISKKSKFLGLVLQ
jgi:hypothetical protein